MELLKFAWIYFFMEFVNGSSIKTVPALDVIIGHSPTLTCTYTYDIGSKDLIFIRWSKVFEGYPNTPVALMKDGKDPEWLPTAGDLFKENVNLTTSSAATNVAFNLRFRAFGCADEGTYECEVFTYTQTLKSQTELIAKAPPGSPQIHDDVIQVKNNDSFFIHCQSDVGIPPVTLSWLYKSRDKNIYQLVTEAVKQENSKSRQCIYKGTSSLEVVMTEELDGAVFLCATSAELGEDMENTESKHFDRVVLQLHRTTTIPPTTTTTKCPGKSCEKTLTVIEDDNSSAGVFIPSPLLLCAILLLTAILSRTVCVR